MEKFGKSYQYYLETYENSVEKIKEIVKQFSVESAFDKISKTYNNNCDLI